MSVSGSLTILTRFLGRIFCRSAVRILRTLLPGWLHRFITKIKSWQKSSAIKEVVMFSQRGWTYLQTSTSPAEQTVWRRERRSMKNMIKWMYLLQLAGLDNGSVTVLVIGQTKQDVVSNRPRHDPRSLRWEGDATAVSDFTLRGHQLSQDHHEQRTLEEKPGYTSSNYVFILRH